MRIVEYEIKRYVVRVKEFRQKMDDCNYISLFNRCYSTSGIGPSLV